MRTFGRSVGFMVCLLTTATAAAQTVRDERPVPQLQFGTTGSFSGFQFQQSTFGSPIGNPIAFPGIPFSGFGTRYDVTPPDLYQSRLDETPAFTPRNVADAFDARFVPSRFPWTPRATSGEVSRRAWRANRGDPFEPPGDRAARAEQERHRRPFGVQRNTTAPNRASTSRRVATEADVRGGRRRPFD